MSSPKNYPETDFGRKSFCTYWQSFSAAWVWHSPWSDTYLKIPMVTNKMQWPEFYSTTQKVDDSSHYWPSHHRWCVHRAFKIPSPLQIFCFTFHFNENYNSVLAASSFYQSTQSPLSFHNVPQKCRKDCLLVLSRWPHHLSSHSTAVMLTHPVYIEDLHHLTSKSSWSKVATPLDWPMSINDDTHTDSAALVFKPSYRWKNNSAFRRPATASISGFHTIQIHLHSFCHFLLLFKSDFPFSSWKAYSSTSRRSTFVLIHRLSPLHQTAWACTAIWLQSL